MAGSIVIFDGNKRLRKDKALEFVSKAITKIGDWKDLDKNPDIKVLDIPKDKKSIGIGVVREAIKYLAEKPFAGKNKFLIINDANTLTGEAQNALLKTLEEPPSYVTVILLTKTLNDLLGTVISRCRKIQVVSERIESEKDSVEVNSYHEILNLGLGEKLDWAGEFSKEEREDVLETLEKWVAEARELMLNSPSVSQLNNVKKIYTAKKTLEETNTNQKLALEALVLNLE